MPELPDGITDRAYQEWSKLPDPIRANIPVTDAWAIHPLTRVEYLCKEIDRRNKLAHFLLHNPKARPAYKRKCAVDPVFFINNNIWTKDPEGKVSEGVPGLPSRLPFVLMDFQKRQWISYWYWCLGQRKTRKTFRKSRRVRITTTRVAFDLWVFRYVPGAVSWLSADSDDAVDKWGSWDSLLGKWRFMWGMCKDAYPWNFPELPEHSDTNKEKYIRFPEWVEKGRPIDQECWGNEQLGLLPSQVAGRGGAASRGGGDEAAWQEKLAEMLDAAEDMTPHLDLFSTAPKDIENLFWQRGENPSVGYVLTPWILDPMRVRGIYETNGLTDHERTAYPGEERGPHTAKWRSISYNEAAEGRTSQEMARNWDIDPMATAGAKVFLNFSDRNLGNPDPTSKTYDLYDPKYTVQWWYDVGMGDPWAFWAIQVKDDQGVIDAVDYWARPDVTIHWWIPLLLGWDLDQKKNWKTAPDRLPWEKACPWAYSREEQEIIRLWHSRRQHNQQGFYRGPETAIGDRQGVNRSPTDARTVESIMMNYNIMAQSASITNQMVAVYEHADQVLSRFRISGKLLDRNPHGTPNPADIFRYWRRRDATEGGRVAKPRHDAYSHGGSAFVYGARWQPAHVQAIMGIAPGTLTRERTIVSGRSGLYTVRRDETNQW